MYAKDKIWIGTGIAPAYLLPQMANRHGLITGATGTGKTVTLKVLAESFSDLGVPVFLADIKGDLAGLAVKGTANPKLEERAAQLGADGFSYRSFPVQFWDLFGQDGHPVRTTVSEMGALLLSRIMGLNDTQTGVLNIVFRIADKKGLLLLDLKDLKAMLQYVGENGGEFTLNYGNISKQTIGAIQRCMLALEDQGGELFFGEPELDILDWMKTAYDGRGYINILHSVRLYQSPSLYSTFLLWMLSELFENLPEAGDLEKPKMVFFFDEAHLLFNDAPKSLLEKIEQVVRLIRSKGIGVYFVTQNPMDLPQNVLNQLGNRIQHALRAYTPAERKNVEAAAESFRPNPAFDTPTAITELATGEALISCLDEDGRPGVVERAFILPPQSQVGAIDEAVREQIIATSAIRGKYEREEDRESAFEQLQDINRRETEKMERRSSSGRGYVRQTPLEKAANAVFSTVGREVGRTLIRGILGSLKR
ncbi:MAG TPA: helicase HerA-like domain-containing protein [Anaerovoracaceae bacterium]|nr:helicase HerA-like domain-containing protein [Anaerovoracaceae bacterium]